MWAPYYAVLGTEQKRQFFMESVVSGYKEELVATVRSYAEKMEEGDTEPFVFRYTTVLKFMVGLKQGGLERTVFIALGIRLLRLLEKYFNE